MIWKKSKIAYVIILSTTSNTKNIVKSICKKLFASFRSKDEGILRMD
jgi:hypothetical protein